MAALTGFLRQLHEELVPMASLNLQCLLFPQMPEYTVGRDSSVSIATHYWLDGLVIKSRWGRDFPHPSRLTLEPTQAHIRYRVFPGGKAAGVRR